MQNREFIYWLFNKDHKALYIDDLARVIISDNTLKPDGQPAHLVHAPDGWKDTLVKYARNIKYWGLFRDFTVPMNFKKDGRKILQEALWKYDGMEAIRYLGINKLDRLNYPPKYNVWYLGELDFSEFKQNKTDFTLQVVEGGLSKYLKAFESTTYEIDIDDDPQKEYVVMDGLPFTNNIEYLLPDGQDITGSGYNPAMSIISQEGSSQGVLNQDVFLDTSSAYPNDKWFMRNDAKYITVNVTGQINIDVKADGNIIVRLERVNSLLSGPGAIVQTIVLFTGLKNAGDNFTIDVNEVIPFNPNERLYLHVIPDAIGPGTTYFTIRKSSLSINYEVTFQQTIIPGLRPLRLLQKLVEKMTEGRYTATSTFLNTWNDITITSGDGLRNLPHSKIRTSLSDFFKFTQIRCCGLGIENDVLRIEDLKYFFQDTITVELGEVSGFEQTIARDLEGNTIKVGYANQTYDNVNGRDEFNVTQEYSTPNTRIVKEIDLTIPYRADPTGIELTRLNLDGKKTTDAGSDNEVFL